MKRRVYVSAVSIAAALAFAFFPTYVHTSSSPAAILSIASAATGNSLQGQTHLDNVVKIYVPNTIHEDQPVDPKVRQKYLDQALTKFSNLFGGATAIDGVGAWVDDKNHKLVKEKVTIVYSFTDKLDDNAINQVVSYAKTLKKEMTQSSITIEVNGKMYFI